MKTKYIAVLMLYMVSSIGAQDASIVAAQKTAITTLAQQNGFTISNLNQYLLSEYGYDLNQLSRQNAGAVIKAFQSEDKPAPLLTNQSQVAVQEPLNFAQPNSAAIEKSIPPKERPRASILESGMSKRFYLIDGNIISGTILSIEGEVCVIETPDGTLNIPKEDILEETAKISKKDDTQYVGPVLKDSMQEIVIRSKYGDVVINKKDIKDMDRYHGGHRVAWAEEKKTFYQGEAVLTDIFMDPTAFPLPAHTFYVSGLSLGYGFTDRFMLRTKFGSNFSGDLNIQAHWRFYHRPTAAKESAAAVGMSLHRNYPRENLVARYSQFVINKATGETLNDTGGDVGLAMSGDDEASVYAELYYVMSYRRTMESGRGKVGAHFGARTNSMPLFQNSILDSGYVWDESFKIPFRLFAGFEYDLSKNMKFIAEVWADNGNKYRTFTQAWDDYFGDDTRFVLDGTEGTYSMLDFDFGFLYAVSETFRVGIHFQQPYLAFYWEFYEL